jgi:hypothetical protein
MIASKRSSLLTIVVAVVMLGACSAAEHKLDSGGARSADGFQLLVVNSDLAVGRNFLTFAVRGPDGEFKGSPESTATVSVRPIRGEESPDSKSDEAVEAVAPFIASGTSSRGLYGTRLVLSTSGEWEVEARFANATAGGLPDDELAAQIVVAENFQTPSPGELAPRSKTKTVASVGGEYANLTSDPHPDPDLYAHSVDEVVGSGRAVVVMFATPLRCKSAICGPALDQLKTAKAMDPDAYYIHVDVYEKPRDSSDDTYVQAVREWRLPTEPMTFVITPSGRVFDRFEGLFLPSQLIDSLAEARSAP